MELLSTGQVAKICRVMPATVRKWAEEGRIVGQKRYRGWMFKTDDVKSFMKTHGMVLPQRFDPVGFDPIELGS